MTPAVGGSNPSSPTLAGFTAAIGLSVRAVSADGRRSRGHKIRLDTDGTVWRDGLDVARAMIDYGMAMAADSRYASADDHSIDPRCATTTIRAPPVVIAPPTTAPRRRPTKPTSPPTTQPVLVHPTPVTATGRTIVASARTQRRLNLRHHTRGAPDLVSVGAVASVTAGRLPRRWAVPRSPPTPTWSRCARPARW